VHREAVSRAERTARVHERAARFWMERGEVDKALLEADRAAVHRMVAKRERNEARRVEPPT
jgi:hypothetical protein